MNTKHTNLGHVGARGLRPQGVGSGGFLALGMHWFWFALAVFVLLVIRGTVLVLAAGTQKEAPMEQANGNQKKAALVTPKLFSISLASTAWAIGTSAVAGALSA